MFKTVNKVLGYNQLVDHVGTHGQRRLTEALNKDSLVQQKEYPVKYRKRHGRSWVTTRLSGKESRSRQYCPSHSECDRDCIATNPENATHRAIAFSGPVPEAERENDRSWIALQTFLVSTQGALKIHN
ncbi:hypothetical protein Taro_052822 [Colocasia esculenta]|uniref:Uncharacterized protein n=1 Tax=Colocasia esculenta TaxID=4460 RepID=A0A843XJN2_COLES|nr:hypothetical protein [Colocasia esculenta]